ncbi:hypothetical protein [Spirosoma aerophilum]
MKTHLLFLLMILPTELFAQSSFADPKQECTGPIFTVVEQLPALIIAKEAFEDSLAAELRTKKFPLKDGQITYRFIVTPQSNILDVRVDAGRVSKQSILKETILQFANLWMPAKQSGHTVCSHVRLKLTFINDKVNIAIFQ